MGWFLLNKLRRLSKKQKTIYHTTTYDRWLNIQKDGYLIPQKSNGAGLTFDNATEEELEEYKGYLFFSTTIDEAKNYASYFDDRVVILELAVPVDILLPDKSDCWNCDTWEESAEINQQVCIKGNLPITYVKKIHLLNNI